MENHVGETRSECLEQLSYNDGHHRGGSAGIRDSDRPRKGTDADIKAAVQEEHFYDSPLN